MKTRVTDFLIYRWRYVIGYTLIVVIVGMVLGIVSLYVPGSLRQGEIDSALRSGALSMHALEPSMVIDLPYHLLQRVSFMLFGVTMLSIKLPSIILGVLTSIGIFLLIRTWFRRNVAIITTLLATTSTQFLFLVQDGTPSIAYSFVVIWTLFAATLVTRKKTFGTFWKVLTGVLLATALYLPLGIYFVLTILTTMFFHPHIRYVVMHFARPRLIMAAIFGVLSTVPLIYASIIDYHVALSLIGFPNGSFVLLDNLRQVGLSLFGFIGNHDTYMLSPVYSLGLVCLILIGVYKLITYKYTARSYITLILGVSMIPLIVLNPEHITSLFPLAVLMIALGIATIITDWYKLFPRNPYARAAGLIPLSVVVLGLIFSGVLRYINNYEYNSTVLSNYSSDLNIVTDQLRYDKATKDSTRLVVAPEEYAFYTLVAHYNSQLSVSTDPASPPGILMMTRSANIQHPSTAEPTMIVTNRMSHDADRLYIYKTATK